MHLRAALLQKGDAAVACLQDYAPVNSGPSAGLDALHASAAAGDFALIRQVRAPVRRKLAACSAFTSRQRPARKLTRAQQVLPRNLKHQVKVNRPVDRMLKDDVLVGHAQDSAYS